MSIAEFDRTFRGQRSFVFHDGPQEVSEILGWDALNLIIENSFRYGDRISVVKEDLRLDRRRFTAPSEVASKAVQPYALRRALSEGHSILLDQVQEYFPPARRLTDAFTNQLGEFVGINVYVSWSTEQCFTTHWDDHDVFILQTEGEKAWRVFKPTREHPTRQDIEYHEDQSHLDLVWEGKLARGSLLYIPRGWWHDARCTGPGSIHMTVGWSNRMNRDVLQFLIEEASKNTSFRQNAARPSVSDGAEANEAFRRLLSSFVEEQCNDGLIGRYWRRHCGSLPVRMTSTLPSAIEFSDFANKDFCLEIAALAPIVALEVRDDEFTLEVGNRRYDLRMSAFDLVGHFARGDRLKSQWVAGKGFGGLSPDESQRLMFELVNEGILSIARDD